MNICLVTHIHTHMSTFVPMATKCSIYLHKWTCCSKLIVFECVCECCRFWGYNIRNTMLNKANGRKATRFSSIFVCMLFFLFGFGGWITTIPIFAMIVFFFSRSLFVRISNGVCTVFFIRLMPRLQMHTDINNYLAIFWAYNSAFSTFCLRLIHPSCRMMNLQQIMCYALESTDRIFRYSFSSYSFAFYSFVPYSPWLSIYRKRDEWNEPS